MFGYESFGREGGREEYFWSGTALELGFDAPRQRWLSVLVKDDVIAEGIDVLRINEEPVHVEQTGPNVGETVLVLVSEGRVGGQGM